MSSISTGGQDAEIKLDGLDDLMKSLEELAKKYPDRAGELLQKEARDTRTEVTKNIREHLNTDGSSKRSLAKAGSYAVSPVQNYGVNQYVELSAKSPHFHLIENGHELIDHRTGSKMGKGFVLGYKFMDEAIRKAQLTMPKTAEKMIETLIKDGGF